MASTMKTTETDASVQDFLHGVPDEARRQDCFTVLELMKRVSGAEPRMWGDSIVGFGNYHYKYASGREGDWFLTGFAPRKGDLTLYISGGFENFAGVMQRLGKYKTGKACLYVKKLSDVDLGALEELVRQSIAIQAGQ